MRTTLSGICLFSDADFEAQHLFILNGKGGQRAMQWRDRERERDRQTDCCCKRVTEWAINLTVGQIFITARERIILDLIKMNIEIIYKNLDGYYFSLDAVLFHPSNKLPIYTTTFYELLMKCDHSLDLFKFIFTLGTAVAQQQSV